MLGKQLLEIAFWTGVTAAGLALALLGIIFLIRGVTRRTDVRRRRFIERWQTVLEAACSEMPDDLPDVPPSQAHLFLRLWNHAYESLPVEESQLPADQARRIRNRLQMVAHRVEAGRMASGLVTDGTFREQIEAMKSLGYLQEYGAWPELRRIAEASNGYLSSVALQALLYMNQPESLPLIAPFPASMVVSRPLTRSRA